jgi:hypothetical protein
MLGGELCHFALPAHALFYSCCSCCYTSQTSFIARARAWTTLLLLPPPPAATC